MEPGAEIQMNQKIHNRIKIKTYHEINVYVNCQRLSSHWLKIFSIQLQNLRNMTQNINRTVPKSWADSSHCMEFNLCLWLWIFNTHLLYVFSFWTHGVASWHSSLLRSTQGRLFFSQYLRCLIGAGPSVNHQQLFSWTRWTSGKVAEVELLKVQYSSQPVNAALWNKVK